VSLADLQEVYRVLYFGRGANMPAANAVRNHLALVNGKHPRYVGDATLVQILTTEVPPKLRSHLYEPSKHGDAYQAATDVLRSYRCWDQVPDSVRAFLERRDPRYGPVRPAEVAGKPHHYFRVMGPEYMIEAARRKAEEMGLNVAVFATSLNDVEARPTGESLGVVAQEIEVLGRPMQPPCVLLCGGELLVTVGDETGVGGRSQEFVLSAALRIDGSRNVVVASADSDGTDGPSDADGGIVDGQTMARARELGLNVSAELDRHNSNPVLRALGDAIDTGTRWTNVRDLRVIYVGGRA
jgi:glycerate 2-kinase